MIVTSDFFKFLVRWNQMHFLYMLTKPVGLFMITHNADVYFYECRRGERSCALNVENHVFFLNT
jgi:hypothetical protein